MSGSAIGLKAEDDRDRDANRKEQKLVYEVSISKGNREKYGIAYRVVEDLGVIIMGVFHDYPGGVWNTMCDLKDSLCVGDSIVSANDETEQRAIVTQLLESQHIKLVIQKTGPRWHIDAARLTADLRHERSHTSSLGSSEAAEEKKQKKQHGLVTGWLACMASVFAPNFFMLAVFSDIGMGIKTFTFLSPETMNFRGNLVVLLGSIMAVNLVVFDVMMWKSKVRKNLCAMACAYFICAGAVMKCRFYPFAPLVIIIFHVPIFLGITKARILGHWNRRSFYVGVTTSAFACCLAMLAVWLGWMNIAAWDGLHQWNDATKMQLVTDCTDMYENFKVEIGDRKRSINWWWDCSPDHRQDYDYLEINAVRYIDAPYQISDHRLDPSELEQRALSCARVKTIWFLAYTTPMICVGCTGILGVFCLFNGVLINVEDTGKLEKVLKQFILMISFLVFTMYVSSSVAGASMRLTGVIMAFCASGLIALCVWLYLEIGRSAITTQVNNSKLMQSLLTLATSDWVRACAIIGLNMLIPMFLCLDMLHQWVRKKRGREPRDGPVYTRVSYRIIMATLAWNWASILVKANYLVMLYWTLSVGVAKLTYVFLSWLNEQLLKISFVAVLAIFFLIGFTMFMLPPVPGIPVYICSGIVISARARNIPEAGNFWGGMCIAILESLVLKICACCGQYMIGHFMGKSVKVQQLVAVDKVFTRSIERILDTRGLNLPKVSVLVGGPDWPTSVLCGILKLNLFQVCLGTLPVIFVSAPCVIAGAFLSNPGKTTNDGDRRLQMTTLAPSGKKDNEIWPTLSTLALSLSFMCQLAGMVLALYYIQEVVQKDHEELARPRPEHAAVTALTRKESAYVEEYTEVTAWSTLAPSRRHLIITATAINLLSTFMFVMMDEACFLSFQVSSKISDPISEEGLDGNALNIVQPLGWFANGCFFLGCTLHFMFTRWASKTTAARLKKKEEPSIDSMLEEDMVIFMEECRSLSLNHVN